MKKVRLNIKQLSVESFIVGESGERGTIQGNEYSAGYEQTGCACPAPPPTKDGTCESCPGHDGCPTGWTYCPLCF